MSPRPSKARQSTTQKIELRDGRRTGFSVVEFFRFRRLRIGCWRSSRPQVGPDPQPAIGDEPHVARAAS